jgi:hypothetical protein
MISGIWYCGGATLDGGGSVIFKKRNTSLVTLENPAHEYLCRGKPHGSFIPAESPFFQYLPFVGVFVL